jgi:hypothetical protein
MNDFTAPRTWTVGELVTKAILDQHIRDNQIWLRAVAEQAGRTGMFVGDDCFFVPGTGATPFLAGGVSASVSGTGAAVTLLTSTAANPGQLGLAAGTTTTGSCALIGPADQIELGTNEVRFQGIIGLSALSDGTNRYTARCGLGDSATAESVDFVGFRYADNVNGGEWQGVTRANSVETTLDTNSVAAVTYTALSFTVNAAGTSVTFYIGGTSVGSITTNIPTGSARKLTFLPGLILKSLGTTSRSVQVDAYTYLQAVSR